MTHLGNWLTHLAKQLTRLGGQIARLREVKPSPLQILAILVGLAALSIAGGIAFPGNAIGQSCVVAFVPGLCIAIGILGNRWYRKQGLDQQLAKAIQNAAYATLHLKNSVRYIDDRLSEAQGHLENGRKDAGFLEVMRAKTATELSLGAADQASRQWESVPVAATHAARVGLTDDDNPPRPRITEGNSPRTASTRSDTMHPADNSEVIAGSVARVEDQYTLIINRGLEHGTEPGMVFAVLADDGDEILDPETGQVIGEVPIEKLRVKAFELHPKYSRAATFRTFTPATVQYPALTGIARTTSGFADQPSISGAFDAIDESISKMIETELAGPVREKIANAKPIRQNEPTPRRGVTVNIGDKVRQIVPDRGSMPGGQLGN